MPSRADLDRLFSRRTPSRRVDPPAPAAPAGGAPTAALPPPPPGYQYMYDQTHGRYVLVQVAMPGAPAPAANLVGPSGQPLAMPPGPTGTRSAQMLRPGVDGQGNQVDKYGEFLSRIPDLDPRSNPIAGQLYPHLVPDPAQVLQQFPPPRPIFEKAPENLDPAADAWGTRAPVTRATGLAE